MKFNDLDLSEWQQSDINTDSLWIIPSRDKTGKHKKTLFECENLGRKYIGFDINQKIIEYVAENIEGSQANKFYITNCNAMDKESVEANFRVYQSSAQFLIIHSLYMDMIKCN